MFLKMIVSQARYQWPVSLLRQAGIVVDEKRGNMVFYRLAVPCVSQFFACIESVLQAQTGAAFPRRA